MPLKTSKLKEGELYKVEYRKLDFNDVNNISSNLNNNNAKKEEAIFRHIYKSNTNFVSSTFTCH